MVEIYKGRKLKIMQDILRRAGLGGMEYLTSGHPDIMFRNGPRTEIKTQGDLLSSTQRKELEWMTERGEPWLILQEVGLKTHGGPVVRIANLRTYDLYQEHRIRNTCDWTKRVLPLGTVLAQKYSHNGGCLRLKVLCAKCRKPVWKGLVGIRTEGLEAQRCRACGQRGWRGKHLTPKSVHKIREAKRKGKSIRALALKLGINYGTACMAASYRTWRNLQ